MPRVRVRQHVNPLAKKYQNPVVLPDWSQVFEDMNRPIHLDIGCARGRFPLMLAPLQPDWNILGLEIRESLVVEANRIRDEQGLKNLHYLFCNVNVDGVQIFDSLPPGRVQWVSIQFPDPWFKQRHAKRRVVQPELVALLAERLPVGARVFLQSDVEAIAQDMTHQFTAHPAFACQHASLWLPENPLPVTTERERATHRKGQPVYRSLFARQSS
ncbi:tRNA (guanosine(46)-N7)-methyltransferase TrmB [Spirulina major CS-329]|jgi:tRNA (guanine-N7-)-methyltransferase|uniref:tRNA (guanosine(46)-N7)-methyltransferase TrmB n=1 Tax=Spirulina TaxID=1154 RepID=UPI00232DBF56|nr:MULTISPECIES: tRNA (guanosine(46)-N7)-methyltransferase TrmB [Spirulina]MDB9494607.1 tRNA (guanosine(46)-N7)-methyltransferase TrmB [Spirulina subsalsa CS-330]MDB9504857.1 tRNA (guanosine(46)-N7)-methyltransferase TrmB [Spirulina major CS-329]